jgi:ubiquitin carboxyl-terminal hydrolase 7
MDGDIIVFQTEPPAEAEYELPTAREYYRELFYRVSFTFMHLLNG